MVYDETNAMIQAMQHAFPKWDYADVVEKVRKEQEKCGWLGLYRIGGAHTRVTESIGDKR